MKKLSYQSNLKLRFIIVVICLFLSVISKFVNTDTLVFLLFFLYLFLLLQSNLIFIIKFIFNFITIGTAVLGVYIIENSDLYLVELSSFSKHSGSFPLFVGYYLTFLIANEIFEKKNLRIKKATCFQQDKNINCMLDILGVILFLWVSLMVLRLVITTKPCFYLHMDKFYFKNLYIYGFWKLSERLFFYFIPVILINLIRKKKLSLVTLMIYIIYYIWIGSKFTEFIKIAFFLILPCQIYLNVKNSNLLKKFFKKLVIIVFCLLLLVLISYLSIYQSSTALAGIVYQRLAQQGQLWWSIYTQQINQPSHFNEIADELTAFFPNETSKPYYGLYKIMYLCAPSEIVTRKIAGGSAYTESTAASIYYYFGSFWGPFILIGFAIAMGFGFSYLSKQYIEFIRDKRFIEAIITTRLIWMLNVLFHMSNFKIFFGVDTILILILVFLKKVGLQNKKIET